MKLWCLQVLPVSDTQHLVREESALGQWNGMETELGVPISRESSEGGMLDFVELKNLSPGLSLLWICF